MSPLPRSSSARFHGSAQSCLILVLWISMLLISFRCIHLKAEGQLSKADVEHALIGKTVVSRVVLGRSGKLVGFGTEYPVTTLLYLDGPISYRVEWAYMRGEVGQMSSRFAAGVDLRITKLDVKDDGLELRLQDKNGNSANAKLMLRKRWVAEETVETVQVQLAQFFEFEEQTEQRQLSEMPPAGTSRITSRLPVASQRDQQPVDPPHSFDSPAQQADDSEAERVESERKACCSTYPDMLRFCEKHIKMTPNHDPYRMGKTGNALPCMWTIEKQAESPENEEDIKRGWGVTPEVLQEAQQADREFQAEATKMQAEDERKKQETIEASRAQDAIDRAEHEKRRQAEIQARLKDGPPIGATLYRGMYIGEPMVGINKRSDSCPVADIEAVLTSLLKQRRYEACMLTSNGDWLGGIYDFVTGSERQISDSLIAQFGDPLPGRYRMLDSEAIPIWKLWKEKDNTIIGAKRDHASYLDQEPVYFTEIVVFKR